MTPSSEADAVEVERKCVMTWRLKCLLAIMCLTSLASTLACSCIAPFFPLEADEKQLSQTQIGIIFANFELVMLIVSPVWGRFMPQIGSKFMFVSGLFVSGVTAIMFG